MLMNTEKTVRKQAKKVLEGNRSVIISEIMVAVLAFLTGLFAFSLAMSVAGLYDVKNPNQLSNSGINSPGETNVPSDFCHLASASMLTSSPVSMLHLG